MGKSWGIDSIVGPEVKPTVLSETCPAARGPWHGRGRHGEPVQYPRRLTVVNRCGRGKELDTTLPACSENRT